MYPRKGVIESLNLGLQALDDANSKNAQCFFASVGIANANGSTDLEMSIPTRGAGYYVAYNGIEELTPVKVRDMTGANAPLPTYDRDGTIVGSVRRGADDRYTILANDGADVSAMLMSICLIFAGERDVSEDQRLRFSLWGHLPTDAWTETHQQAFALALIHYFMEVRTRGGTLPPGVLKAPQVFPPQALQNLRHPLTDEIRSIFESMFAD